MQEFPGQFHGSRQALMVERYIEQHPFYPFLKAIEDGVITSQGILLTRYFPSPLLKRMLLSYNVQRCLKRIYFQFPSATHQNYFSAEDRALLHDLEKFAIPTFWVDQETMKILQYVQKPDKDSGMFVPLDRIDNFLKATLFGIYGSNLQEGHVEEELRKLLQGILSLRLEVDHPLCNKNTPIAMVTGGGPGAMEVGNRLAKELGILSCANIVDFRAKSTSLVNEQNQNIYIDAKMTYRIDQLVERQAEFHLDFPIFLIGGIGTDFEYALEEVRRKVGSALATPILLMGSNEYWTAKITGPFATNLQTGTIKGSEWIGNSFYAIQNADQGIAILRAYFLNTLPIGKNGPIYEEGFIPSTKLHAHLLLPKES
jgi:predicted Rossmann-fold nucleotide-binding protein